MRRYLNILCAALTLWCGSCIENDIPYPVVPVEILGLEGTGFAVGQIDPVRRTVTLTLDERTDIERVTITSARITDKATGAEALTGTFDLRTPLYVTLSLYQDYEWTVRAEQSIERHFRVGGQIGTAEIDDVRRIARARVTGGTDLHAVDVESLKLGPADITAYSPSVAELSGSSFETVRFVDVTCHGRTERWLLYVERSESNVELTQADAWTKVIWLYGAGIEGGRMGFRYRRQGAEQWSEVPGVEVDGSTFKARLAAEPATAYEVAAYCDQWESEVRTLTTDPVWTLPNGGFEEWSAPDGDRKYYIPFFTGSDPFWDSGNQGATTIREKDNITTPADDPRPGSSGSKSARLESRWVFIKFAAGNLFAGEYLHTFNTNGVVGFGRPFTHRPTALKGWVKFKGGKINRVGGIPAGLDEAELKAGRIDENGMIYIALGTWKPDEYGTTVVDNNGKTWNFGTETTPVAIYTKDLSTFFDPRSKDVIAYGEKVMIDDIDQWTEFTIPLEYKNGATDLVPTHLIIVCSASRWGDYFTGYDKSVLCVDDFELVYD